MKILVACENSLIVSSAFASKGHEVTTYDLLPISSTRNFKPHASINFIQGDVTPALSVHWDLLIAFPHCTWLTSAASWRWKETMPQIQESVAFVKKLWNANATSICIENPTGWLNNNWMQPHQILSPHYFGSRFQKRTCFWLKNLPPLLYTCTIGNPRHKVKQYGSNHNKSKLCSKFTPELAEAMATQWNF